jgi:cell division inhibitor SulA/protein ImuA
MSKRKGNNQPAVDAKGPTPASAAGVFFSSPEAGQPIDGTPSGAASDSGRRAASDDPAALLDQLIDRAAVWRGGQTAERAGEVCASGYAELDRRLPGGGWPVAGLTELLSDTTGVGELRLFMPGLAGLIARRPGWIVWIAPPHMPYAPALLQWGIEPDRILLIHPRSAADAMWAAEQALSSGTCAAVLLWAQPLERRGDRPPRGRASRGRQSIERALPGSMAQLARRLQMAASTHRSWAIMFRGVDAQRQPSAAMLRLRITGQDARRDLHLLKVRGGRPAVIRDFDAGIDVGEALFRPVEMRPAADDADRPDRLPR